MLHLPDPCDVYYNLTRRVWSLRSRQTGLVLRHARVVVFAHGAALVVQPSGRARVLESGHKTVHAFVRGEQAEIGDHVAQWLPFARAMPDGFRLTYNPTRAGHFTRKDTGAPVGSVGAAVMIAPEGQPPEVWAIPHQGA